MFQRRIMLNAHVSYHHEQLSNRKLAISVIGHPGFFQAEAGIRDDWISNLKLP